MFVFVFAPRGTRAFVSLPVWGEHHGSVHLDGMEYPAEKIIETTRTPGDHSARAKPPSNDNDDCDDDDGDGLSSLPVARGTPVIPSKYH